MSFKAKLILNSALVTNNVGAIIPYFVIENDHGKFLFNWTVVKHSNLIEKKLPNFAATKHEQMLCTKAHWLDDDPMKMFLQEVCNGKSGTIVEKVQAILEGTTNGQRVLVCVEQAHLDKDIYEALGINARDIDPANFGKLEDYELEVEEPYVSVPEEEIAKIHCGRIQLIA